jgi:hypothetical protein
MHLLTWHGTILRIDAERSVLVHASIWPAAAGQTDFAVELPDSFTAPLASADTPDIVLEPGTSPGIVHFRRGDLYLKVVPGEDVPAFSVPHKGPWESFLTISAVDLATLRHMLGHGWAVSASGGPALEVSLWLNEGFRLDVAGHLLDLSEGLPTRVAPDRFQLVTVGARLDMRQMPGAPRREILMRPLPYHRRATEAASVDEFRAVAGKRLKLPGPPDIISLPMTVCDADRDWLHLRPYAWHDPLVGRHAEAPELVREHNKYVLLARHMEGMVLDEHGVSNEIGYLAHVGNHGHRHLPMPPYMRCVGERLFVDRDALESAPALPGAYAVFYGGNLSNYTHWVIDAMLPLHVMLPYLPPGTRLLIPGTLRGFGGGGAKVCDHHGVMRQFGFGDLPALEVADMVCRVEEVYWLDNALIWTIPGENLRALRAHILARRSPPGTRDKRVYIARRQNRRVSNQSVLDPFLARNGFAQYFLEDLSVEAQIELFRHAAWVIGPHGAELGNLLFCQPGTKVLELSPDLDFKQYFSVMSSKLGLLHGVLPCPTHDGGFFGDMTVDMEKLRALFRMMHVRL